MIRGLYTQITKHNARLLPSFQKCILGGCIWAYAVIHWADLGCSEAFSPSEGDILLPLINRLLPSWWAQPCSTGTVLDTDVTSGLLSRSWWVWGEKQPLRFIVSVPGREGALPLLGSQSVRVEKTHGKEREVSSSPIVSKWQHKVQHSTKYSHSQAPATETLHQDYFV